MRIRICKYINYSRIYHFSGMKDERKNATTSGTYKSVHGTERSRQETQMPYYTKRFFIKMQTWRYAL